MMLDIQDRDVILVDDIFDTGKTLSEIVQRMNLLSPKSIRTAVLVQGKKGRKSFRLSRIMSRSKSQMNSL